MAETQLDVRVPVGVTACLVDGCRLMATLECRNCGTCACPEHREADHAIWCGFVSRVPRPLARKIPVATGGWDERVVTGEKPRRRRG